MRRELLDLFFRRKDGGTKVSLVPESTLRRSATLTAEKVVAVAERAIESDQSLLESESQARFTFPEENCLMRASYFVFKSLFFFCMQVLTS